MIHQINQKEQESDQSLIIKINQFLQATKPALPRELHKAPLTHPTSNTKAHQSHSKDQVQFSVRVMTET